MLFITHSFKTRDIKDILNNLILYKKRPTLSSFTSITVGNFNFNSDRAINVLFSSFLGTYFGATP